jgi:hypothetical protein
MNLNSPAKQPSFGNTGSEPSGPWTSRVLVIANKTADSDALLESMKRVASREPTAFTLIVPQRDAGLGSRAAAFEALARGLARARKEGLEVDGRLGPSNPVTACAEAFDPRKHDRIIVSTLHVTSSRWLALDVLARIRRLTGADVSHVEAEVRRKRSAIEPRARAVAPRRPGRALVMR